MESKTIDLTDLDNVNELEDIIQIAGFETLFIPEALFKRIDG